MLSEIEIDELKAAVLWYEMTGRRRRTNWILITGAPGSGKTTLVRQFANNGWKTLEDPGRAEFEDRLKVGLAPEEVRKDYMGFQERVLTRVLKNIESTSAQARTCFDYGVAEALAFMKMASLPWPTHFIQAAASFKFESVLLLDPLPSAVLMRDNIRVESEKTRNALHLLIEQIYTLTGHNVQRLGFAAKDDRYRAALQLLTTHEKQAAIGESFRDRG